MITLKNSQVKIFDAYCLNYLCFSLPITPEVTLKGYRAKSTNKTKLEGFICFQS